MSKSFKIRVKIDQIGETEDVGKNTEFLKREVIGILEGEWPEYFKFELIKDKTKLADDLLEGTYVTVHFNLKGKKVEGQDGEDKYFTSLQAWKFETGE